MARPVEQHWQGLLSGLVVTRYGYAVPCERIEIVEAAHPVPDAAGMHAAQRILERVRNLSENDLVLCLISGAVDLRRHHWRDELRAASSVGHQRWPIGRGVPPGASADAAAYILGDAIEGEASDVATVFGGMALQVAERGQPFVPPCVLLSGCETTVTLRGNGRGGRNVDFLLSLGIALDGHPRIHALAGDTDGVDGQEEIAGAYIGPDSLGRAGSLGLRPKDMLADNDGHGFFSALGDSVITGPTLTNVNDFRAILVEDGGVARPQPSGC